MRTRSGRVRLALAGLGGLIAAAGGALALQPHELAPPRVAGPLHAGAQVVQVWGLSPPAAVEVVALSGAQAIPKGSGPQCPLERCDIIVEALSEGEIIAARQTADGITSALTRADHRVTVAPVPGGALDPNDPHKEKLKPPRIGEPLRACQRVLPADGVVPGAFVRAYRAGETEPIGQVHTPYDDARPVTDADLVEGEDVEATQALVGRGESDRSASARVGNPPSTSELPPPAIKAAGVIAGATAITLYNLWVGAVVEAAFEKPGEPRQVFLRAIAPWTGTTWPIPPMPAAWADCPDCIKATQSLCSASIKGAGVPMRTDIDPPFITKPVCPGSWVVPVCRAERPTTLRLFRRAQPQDQQISQQGALVELGQAVVADDERCTPMTLGDSTTLADGDAIYVRKSVGTLAKDSPDVSVKAQSSVSVAVIGGRRCQACGGIENLPVFRSDELGGTIGPVFTAAMCGAESATVVITSPFGKKIGPVTLSEVPGRKGHFEGRWDWAKLGWTSWEKVHHGIYTTTFTIAPAPAGGVPKVRFRVTAQDCLSCQYAQFRQDCVDLINTLRKQEGFGPLQRSPTREDCSDKDARANYAHNIPHYSQCGTQNECPPYSSLPDILSQCIKNNMYGEKSCWQMHINNDKMACYSLKDYPSCECQWGHYANMMDATAAAVACGIYVTPSGQIKSVQNFFK